MRPKQSFPWKRWSAVIALAAVVVAAGLAAAWLTGAPAAPVSTGDPSAWGPAGLAPTFTEKPFWIILGLVVLGWIVLAADLPDSAHW